MVKKINKKQWLWFYIVNIVILIILILLTCIFIVLFIINQQKYAVAFLIIVLFLSIWVIGYFTGHFFFINKNIFWGDSKKIMTDSYKEDKKNK